MIKTLNSAILEQLNAEKAIYLRGVQKFSLVARLRATETFRTSCGMFIQSAFLSRPGCQPHAARATNERKV